MYIGQKLTDVRSGQACRIEDIKAITGKGILYTIQYHNRFRRYYEPKLMANFMNADTITEKAARSIIDDSNVRFINFGTGELT